MKDIYLVSQVEVSPSILQGANFGQTVRDFDQSLRLVKNSNFEKGKKYVLKINAPVTHGMRLTLNDAVYLPRSLTKSAKSFYEPYSKPIIKEHITGAGILGNPAPDAIGRVKFASYQDFRGNGHSQMSFQDSIAQVQDLMNNGLIYDENFQGFGAIIAQLNILDQDSIEKFLDERILNFSVGGRTKEIYSPFNGKHISDLTDEDYTPYDIVDGKKGFKVVGDMVYDELSATLTPADVLAKVTDMELQEFQISDSAAQSYRNKINSNKNYFLVDGIINLEGEKIMADEKQYSLRDYCGPDNTFPVTSKEEGIKALQDLKDSSHSDQEKVVIKKAIEIKMKEFSKKEKSPFLDKEVLKDSLDKLNSFEVINFALNLKDSLFNSLDKETFISLFDLADPEDKGKEVVLAELKDAKLKVASQENQIKDLETKLEQAQKSFIFLAKAVRDNLELTSFEDLQKVEQTEKTFQELLKDTVLFEKLAKIFNGSDPNAQLSDSNLESDVANSLGKPEEQEVSDQIKLFQSMFSKKKIQDGETSAIRWLKNLKDSKYISEDDFNLITKED